jgi:hypothetical protein
VVPNESGDAAASRTSARCLRAILLMACVGLTACASDPPSAPAGPPAVLERVSGDGQSAAPGAALARPLIARLVDADGHPVRRAEVRWEASAGAVTPAVSTTDANGETKAVWQLGTEAGMQRATATAEGLPPVVFAAFVDANALPDRLPLRRIDFATFDGSGQVVHPDVVMPPFDGLDDNPRMAITPYPGGNASFENPSIFVGEARDTWRVPSGLTNPVVKPSGGYLSDPDMVWLADRHEFWLYYRHVNADNEILVASSTDGVRWGASRSVVRVANHQAVSPTVVRRTPTDWLMWTVNSGPAGCSSASTTVELRRSADGLSWSPPTTVALSQPGVFPWHLDVQWIPALGEYWAMFNGKVAGSCTTDALYLATSPDGLTWRTYRSPVLRRGAIPEFADVVYRATFTYEADRDLVSIWYSGARSSTRGYEWRAAYERRRRDDVFAAVGRADNAYIAASTAPPLTNESAP